MPGSWDPLQNFEPQSQDPPKIVAIHLIHLPNGKFLAIGFNGLESRLWIPPPMSTPGRGKFVARPNSHNNTFCSGHCRLPDGRCFVAGGGWGAGFFASKLADVFDPSGSGGWNPSPYPPSDMEHHRWYPTCTMLGNNGSGAPHMKVLVTLGRIHRDDGGNSRVCEIYNPASPPGSWAEGPEINIVPTYPFNFVLPDGRVFCAGPRHLTRFLDANLTAWSNGPTNSDHQESDHCSAVMFLPGRILKVGGSMGQQGDTAVDKVSYIDMTAPSPAWQMQGIAQMKHPRQNHNLTLLPDGKVLITGGNLVGSTSDPVFAAELYDPIANTMTELPPMDSNGPRWYHSTAALLPDGRVVVAGGNNKESQQIFRPPYFDGTFTRPVIGGAPSVMKYANAYSFGYTPTNMSIAW